MPICIPVTSRFSATKKAISGHIWSAFWSWPKCVPAKAYLTPIRFGATSRMRR